MQAMIHKVVDFDTITLTDGGQVARRIPSENLITAVILRLTAVSANGPPASVLLDGILNLLEKVRLRANGRNVFDLPGPDQFLRQTYLQGVQAALTQATTTVGAVNVTLRIPLALPRPAKYPERLISGLPAGIINTLELEIQAPTNLINAVFGTPGTTSFSTAPTVQVSTEQIEMSQTDLRTMLRNGQLQGYIQTLRQQTNAAAGDNDVELDSGRGRLLDLYARNINNSAASETITTNVALLLGSNRRPVESRHLVLQARAKELYQIETVPAGTIMIPFNVHGKLNEFLPLDNQTNVRLRFTDGTPTAVANHRVIQGTIIPEFYREIANLQ